MWTEKLFLVSTIIVSQLGGREREYEKLAQLLMLTAIIIQSIMSKFEHSIQSKLDIKDAYLQQKEMKN